MTNTPPTEEEVQRLVETHPNMHMQATSLLRSILRGETNPQDVSVQITELKLQAEENLATALKLARSPKKED